MSRGALNFPYGFVLNTVSKQAIRGLAEAFRPYVCARGEAMLDDWLERNKEYPRAYARWVTQQEVIRLSGHSDPEFDTAFTLFVIVEGGRALGTANCAQKEWLDAWMAQPGVSEYRYWEHEPRPAEIGEAEWEARRSIWLRVASSETLAANAMFLTLSDPNGVRRPDLLV